MTTRPVAFSRTVTGRDPSTGESVAVTIDGGLITEVKSSPAAPGPWISAGLVDLQVNGYGGHDVNSAIATPDTVSAMVTALYSVGVTTVVPTLVTSSFEHTDAALRVIAAAHEDEFTRDAIPFVHLEGPYISSETGPRGVHDQQWIRPPDLEEFRLLQEASGGIIGMVTLSPHYPEAVDFTKALVHDSIRVSIGHTHADHAEIIRTIEAGATLSTHLGNGAHQMLSRHPNYIWSQLADDRLLACFIADGHHLPTETLTAMIRAKGVDHSILVSDATALAGAEPGEYDQPVGGPVTLDGDGRLSHSGSSLLAGAAAGLSRGVAVAASVTGLGLAQALQMASQNPAHVVGRSGLLAVGERADIIRFVWEPNDVQLNIVETLVAGRTVYEADV